jgi:DNA processing protein
VQDIRLTEALGLMTLRGLHGLGPVTIGKVLDRFETIGALMDASQHDCKGTLNARQYANLRENGAVPAAYEAARRERERADRDGIQILTPRCPGYPERLAAVPERPMLLYVLGDLATTQRSVACVGTRYPTAFGKAVTERFVACLADGQWTVVSGLAEGIDDIAHEAALLHETPTVAVIACGMDMLYEERQRRLATRILDAGGAIVSEQPFGTAPEAGHLIRRNRIQSGLSAGVVVLQAKRDGGTMQTARYALIQGRPLFAPVPPERLAHEDASAGLILLTSGTGPDLVAALGAREPFAGMMAERFPDGPVAAAIRSRDDYPLVLERLEQEVGPSPAPVP